MRFFNEMRKRAYRRVGARTSYLRSARKNVPSRLNIHARSARDRVFLPVDSRPEPKARVSIHTSCGLANFTPVERILFFLTSRPKIPYFRFGAGREWSTFGPM